MERKQAVLAVSFGTSHLDTLEKNISAVEQAIADALPGYDLRRAFTSGVIVNKLKTMGMEIDTVPEAMEALIREGYARVVIQPTHVINGEEFDKLCRMTAPFAHRIAISMGQPLLTSVQDYRALCDAMMASIPAPEEDEVLLFMGHGSAHYANAAYALLEYMLHDLGWERALIATVEGYPELPQAIARLRRMPAVRRVRLHPLMVVAGDHAKNDMAGQRLDSWKNVLEGEGYQTACVLRGMGEYPAVRRLFGVHARQAAMEIG